MSGLPPITDHEFARLVKRRCEDMSRSMAEIAEELGSTPDELCRWIMAYREPSKAKQYLSRFSAPKHFEPRQATGEDARRFENWRRARDGAAATLAASAEHA